MHARSRKVSTEELKEAWDRLFDANPWLEGLSSHCDDVFCCPSDPYADYMVLSEAGGLLFLATGRTRVSRLERNLME